MKNVYKGWKTTVIGLAMIGGAIASVFVKNVSWTEASIGVSVGAGFLFAPDTFIDKLIGKNAS